MKAILVLALVVCSAYTFSLTFQPPNLTNKEIIQQDLNGIFEQNKLKDPVTIVPCIDDASAKMIVDFLGKILDKAAKGSIADIISIIQDIKDFGAKLDPKVGECLDGNKQIEALGLKYGITPDTNSSDIQKKVVTYVTLHYFTVHKWFGSLNDQWLAGKYYQVGFDFATYGHQVLGLTALPNLTDKEIIQQGLNGLFEQNKLKDPVTIVACFDDASAKMIVDFAGKILDKAAKGSIADIIGIIQDIKDFGDKLDPKVKACLDGNKQLEALGLKYGITPDTNSSDIQKKVVTYVTLHYFTVHKWLGNLNDEWLAGKYYQVGFDGATYAHQVLGLTALPNLTNKEIIQQDLNGIFEQNKLKDPVTIVPCIDDASAKMIVDFLGKILDKAAKGSIADIISIIQDIKDFGAKLDPKVGECLDGNKQIEALGLKYGITPDTNSSDIQKKVVTYVTLHYFTVHKWFGSLNDQWLAGKYYQVGFDFATYGHQVLGLTDPNLTSKQILQQFLNGIFEQNKLPDTVTVVPCFDDKNADLTVKFIGATLDKLAKGSISDYKTIADDAKKFASELDDKVKQCLDGNQEFITLGKKYGIDDKTDPKQLEKKIIDYVTLHYLSVHKTFQNMDNDWHGGKYYNVGVTGAKLGHEVLGLSAEEMRNSI